MDSIPTPDDNPEFKVVVVVLGALVAILFISVVALCVLVHKMSSSVARLYSITKNQRSITENNLSESEIIQKNDQIWSRTFVSIGSKLSALSDSEEKLKHVFLSINLLRREVVAAKAEKETAGQVKPPVPLRHPSGRNSSRTPRFNATSQRYASKPPSVSVPSGPSSVRSGREHRKNIAQHHLKSGGLLEEGLLLLTADGGANSARRKRSIRKSPHYVSAETSMSRSPSRSQRPEGLTAGRTRAVRFEAGAVLAVAKPLATMEKEKHPKPRYKKTVRDPASVKEAEKKSRAMAEINWILAQYVDDDDKDEEALADKHLPEILDALAEKTGVDLVNRLELMLRNDGDDDGDDEMYYYEEEAGDEEDDESEGGPEAAGQSQPAVLKDAATGGNLKSLLVEARRMKRLNGGGASSGGSRSTDEDPHRIDPAGLKLRQQDRRGSMRASSGIAGRPPPAAVTAASDDEQPANNVSGQRQLSPNEERQLLYDVKKVLSAANLQTMTFRQMFDQLKQESAVSGLDDCKPLVKQMVRETLDSLKGVATVVAGSLSSSSQQPKKQQKKRGPAVPKDPGDFDDDDQSLADYHSSSVRSGPSGNKSKCSFCGNSYETTELLQRHVRIRHS